MSYYLPTTLKLVNAYKDFDKESVQGENITSAKKEIDLTLDTINQAFEKLYDSFFMNAAMDISTDISVLETLLAQEGLTQKDFKSKQTMGGLTNE
jgi:5-bromo-4-chloroindolyl phosphate hydrolysis protein